jgi:hypothetical protein
MHQAAVLQSNRFFLDSPPNASMPQTPFGFSDSPYHTPQPAAPPYPTAAQGQDLWSSQSHMQQQAPPYPQTPYPQTPSTGYFNTRPTENGGQMVMAMSVTPTPRVVKLEDESELDYMGRGRSRMQSVVPTSPTDHRQSERW